MISTAFPPWIREKNQEIDKKKQLKEELLTKTAKFESTKQPAVTWNSDLLYVKYDEFS